MAWKEGIQLARKLAVEVGMGPENNRVGNGENDDENDRGGGGCPELLGSINHSRMPGTGRSV